MIPNSLSPLWTSLWTNAARELCNHLWQSTLFAGVVALLALALRKYPARARYWLWMAASAKFLIPFSLLIAAGSHLARPTHPTPSQTTTYLAIDEMSQPFTDTGALTPTDPIRIAALTPTRRLSLPEILAAAWFCGFISVLASWLVQWRRVAIALRNATPLQVGRALETLRRIEPLARISRPIPVFSSPALIEPGTMEPGIFGILRPVLLWPEALSPHLDDAHLEAVLAHEACHVRRRDNLTSLLHMLVEAIFWFHPLVWWIEIQLVKERECACDEEVLLLCLQPQVYAESILKVCELCLESPLTCVSGITGADLKQRIVQIMTASIARKLGPAVKLLLLAVGLLAVSMPIMLGQMKGAQRMMLAAAHAAPIPFHTPAHAMIPLDQTPFSGLIAEVQAPTATSDPARDDKTAPNVTPTYVPTMTFDVASVRETQPDVNGHIMMFVQQTPHTTNLRVSFTIDSLLNIAFGVDRFQLVGAPNWPTAYTIEAKGDADADAKMAALPQDEQRMEQQHMLQALMEERFKLKTHWETKEGDTYNLVVAKGGPKLGAEGSMPPSADVVKIFGDRPVPILRQAAYDGKPAWIAHDCSMGNWAALLTSMFGRPVIDKTGLTGKYDFELKYKGRWDSDRSADDLDPTPPMDRALQEQLGLRVEPAKGPAKILVIDHIEKPTSVDGAQLPNPPTAALTSVAFAQASPAASPTYSFPADEMQKAADLQAAGNVDGAIQIYRQIINSSPSGQFAAQAHFHLAQGLLQKGDLQGASQELQVLSQSEYKDLIASLTAQMRPGSQHEYGILKDGRFHHFVTDIDLTIPGGYVFSGCGPSSGNGEQAYMHSQSKPDLAVWMRPVIEPIDHLRAGLHEKLINKPSERGEGWKERPESVQERSFSGKPGISVVADYMLNGKPWVEYLIWINTGKTHTQFYGQAEVGQLAVLQESVDTFANSAAIP